ncbi:MAG: hypothetical protein EA356_01570 [Geminicoccaceae bacterium]|nr:MAG: hypothetical protein EA356_01570 [Geminicoccaceae bacterium]
MLSPAAVTSASDALMSLGGYRPLPGVFDLCVAADGAVRPPWTDFVRRFAALPPSTIMEMQRDVRRRLQATGVAFNVYASPDDKKAAWDLDLVPIILDGAQWARLEAAVTQRVQLAEAVLADLYGRQRLLRERVLPSSLVFGNPEFLYPCSQWPKPPAPYLTTYALDVALDRDGEWVILADQVDAPTGHGWVLASRMALAQAMGSLFMESGVRRLAGYVARLGEALRAQSDEDGRTVLLSSGPHDPSYFSHAFLARYLGVSLVESVDLTMRNGEVFLRSLEGLQRVDVILRKRQGRQLDPLHVPGFGGLGTPGLVDAARLGRVRVANALGSGLLQNRTLGPFAEVLCRTLFETRPLLPEAPVRWLGDADARRQVLGSPAWHLSRMGARHDPGVYDLDMPANEASRALERRLRRTGHRWVAERGVSLATVPAWRDGRLQPVHWAMRLFACVDGGKVHVLPGGLGRLAGAGTAIGLPSGFGSKEVWVTTSPDEPPLPALLSHRVTRVELRRNARDLLSGTAEALFWLGRYTERAESALRTLRAVLVRLLEAGAAQETAELMLHLVRVHLDADPEGETPAARLATGIESLLHGTETTHGLVASLAAVQRNATLARGVLSQDSWTALNALRTDRRWQQHAGPVLTQPPLALVDDSIRLLVAFSGTAAEHMTRNDAWRFLDMGKRLERALQVADLVGYGVQPPATVDPEAALAALLEICDSYMTYRSRYVTLPMPVPVLDLLALDETNPRGLVYQVAQLEQVMAELPADGPYRSPVRRTVLELLTRLRLLDARDLLAMSAGAAGAAEGTALDRQLVAIKASLETTSDQLARAYFVLAETPTTTFSTRRL